MAVMASTSKMRKFQTTFFGEESNKAALFKNIYLVKDLMGFIIFTRKHRQKKNKFLTCKIGSDISYTKPVCHLAERTQVNLGS